MTSIPAGGRRGKSRGAAVGAPRPRNPRLRGGRLIALRLPRPLGIDRPHGRSPWQAPHVALNGTPAPGRPRFVPQPRPGAHCIAQCGRWSMRRRRPVGTPIGASFLPCSDANTTSRPSHRGPGWAMEICRRRMPLRTERRIHRTPAPRSSRVRGLQCLGLCASGDVACRAASVSVWRRAEGGRFRAVRGDGDGCCGPSSCRDLAMLSPLATLVPTPSVHASPATHRVTM